MFTRVMQSQSPDPYGDSFDYENIDESEWITIDQTTLSILRDLQVRGLDYQASNTKWKSGHITSLPWWALSNDRDNNLRSSVRAVAASHLCEVTDVTIQDAEYVRSISQTTTFATPVPSFLEIINPCKPDADVARHIKYCLSYGDYILVRGLPREDIQWTHASFKARFGIHRTEIVPVHGSFISCSWRFI